MHTYTQLVSICLEHRMSLVRVPPEAAHWKWLSWVSWICIVLYCFESLVVWIFMYNFLRCMYIHTCMDNLFPIGITTTCYYSYIYTYNVTSQQIMEITITWLRVDVSECTMYVCIQYICICIFIKIRSTYASSI